VKTLKKRTDFLKINRQGKKCVSHGVILQALPNDLGYSRIGYTVTKKTDPSSVKRNRIKRRLRAAAAEILTMHAKESHDYVLIGRSQTASRPYVTLCNDLKWCLGKLGCAK
jgi:ribonuclease P protein component